MARWRRRSTLLGLVSLILTVQLGGLSIHAHALRDPGAPQVIDVECLLCAHKSPLRVAALPLCSFAPAADAAPPYVRAPEQGSTAPAPLLPASGPRAPPQIP